MIHWDIHHSYLLLEDNLLHAIKSLYLPIQVLLRAVHKEILLKIPSH